MEERIDTKIVKLRNRLLGYFILVLMTWLAIYTSEVVFTYEIDTVAILFIILFAIVNVMFGLNDVIIIDNGLEKRYRFNLVLEIVCLMLCGPIPAVVMVFLSSLVYVPINEFKNADRFNLLDIAFSICLQLVSINIMSIVFMGLGGKTYMANFPRNMFAILVSESFEFFFTTATRVLWEEISKGRTKVTGSISKEYIWLIRYDFWQTVYALLITNTVILCSNSITNVQKDGGIGSGDLLIFLGVMTVLAIIYFPLRERVRDFKTFITFNRQNKQLENLTEQLRDNHKRITRAFVAMLEKRDPYTSGHSERVALYSTILAKKMGLSDERIKQLEMAGLLHDIGKMGVPLEILHKPGKLTGTEYEEIKKHPKYGVDLLYKIYADADTKNDDEFNLICDITKNHHERWDGSGYPRGLKGDDISLESRILAVADTLDAMTSDRSYRKGLSFDIAIDEITKGSGSQFCPKVVTAFLECVEDGSLKVYKESTVSGLLKTYN